MYNHWINTIAVFCFRKVMYSHSHVTFKQIEYLKSKIGINVGHVVTSIKQSPVLKGHILHVLSSKSLYEFNLFKWSHILKP